MGMPMKRGRGIKTKTSLDSTIQNKIATQMPPPCSKCGPRSKRRAIEGRKDGLCANCAQHADTQATKGGKPTGSPKRGK